MSEVNVTPEEQVVNINVEVDVSEPVNIRSTVQAATTQPNAIDPTLTQEGVAADAKATGDAIAAVFTGAKVNSKSFVNKEVTLYASDIAMSSDDGAQTIDEAIESVSGRTAADIVFSSQDTATTAEVVTALRGEVEEGCTDDEIDALFEDMEE